MEIVAIEKQTFEQLIQSEDFAKQINALCGKNRRKERLVK